MLKFRTNGGLAPTQRQTRPTYMDGFGGGGFGVNGGLGVIPRRGFDPATTSFLDQLAKGGPSFFASAASTMPLRLLRILIDTHEMAGMALSNDLAFTFRPGAMKIVAVKDYKAGKGTVDDSETAYLQRLWNRTDGLKRDGEIIPGGQGGGLEGLQKTLAEQQTSDGLSALECVIGQDGVEDIIDFDPLSVQFKETPEGRIAQQRQLGAKGGFKDLDLTTVRLGAWRGSRQNPYGRPRFGQFLGWGLGDIAQQRNINDWLHSMAWPRIAFEYPIERWVQYAKDNLETCCEGQGEDGNDLTPSEWAAGQAHMMKLISESLVSSDFIMMAEGGKANVLNVALGSGVPDLLTQRRLRGAQALDHPPALIGITDGGTQAYATVQLEQYGAKLTGVAADPDRAAEWIANLDLRARGVDMVARVERVPIVLTDALINQQARALEIGNELSLVDRGYRTDEDAALTLTGSGVADPARAIAAHQRSLAAPKTPLALPAPAKEN